MLNFFSNIFGSSNDRTLKKMMVHVSAANNLEKELSCLLYTSDAADE